MAHRIITILIYVVIYSIVNGKVFSTENYKFRTYRVENGLSQNTIWCSLQDHEGFLWFGTKDGLNRFDGKEFIVFQHNPQDSLSIGNNFIRALYEEKNHKNILVGTDDGLYRLNLKDGSFKSLDLPERENLRQTAINSICEDKDGQIWIGTFGHGIYILTPDCKISKIIKAGKSQESITNNYIWKIYRDSDGVMWIGTLGGGLMKYIPKTKVFQCYDSANGLSNDIYEIFEDSGGRLWIGTWNNGLINFDREKNTCTIANIPANSCEAIRCITEEEPGDILFGCNEGLFHYNIKNDVVEKIPLKERHPNILVNDGIYSFLHDNEGGLWIGGYFAGINYNHKNSNVFEHYRLSNDPINNIGHVISDMVEDKANNRIWIATEDNGLACFDRKSNKIFFINKNKISHDNLHALMLSGEELWVGNVAGRIDVYNVKSGTVRHYDYNDGLNVGGVYAIYQDSGNNIYVGGVYGLLTYDLKADKFIRVIEFPVNAYVYEIMQSANGILWIATYGDGIFTYNPRSKIWQNYVHNPNDDKSISSNKIICLNNSDPATIWIGTEGGGLSRYNIQEDNFTNITRVDGLPSEVVYGVEQDKEGNIWITTNKGLSSYIPQKKLIKTYFYHDGIQSSQFNYKASLSLEDGTLCFGGIDGLNLFNPNKIEISEYLPPVRITTYVGKGKGDDYPQRHLLPYPNDKELSHIDLYDSNSVTLEFVALSFIEPMKNQYAYKLSGVDKDWVMCGNENKAIYHNLDPGKYIFEVKGANGDGIWNPEIKKLEIEIHPPYYKSTMAYVIYAVLILAIIGWVTNISIIKIKRRNQIAKLRFERDKQYEYYEGQLNFFSRMAHEIRTPLSLINAPLEDIENKYPDDVDFKEAVDVMKNNTHRLLSLVNELLDFRKGSQGINLNFTVENIGDILNELYKQMLPYSKHKDIQIIYDQPTNPIIAGVDKEALNKIIVNLIFNAIKYTKSKVEIKLTVNEKSDSYIISISDNGKGIKEEDKTRIFTLFYRVKTDETIPESGSGIGLAIVKHYVEAHKGKITVTNNTPTGTIFNVIMPLSLIEQPDVKEEIMLDNKLVSDDTNNELNNDDVEEHDEKEINQNKIEKIARINHSTRINSILVVEDNEDLRNFLVKKLSSDYEVISAENGKIALSLLNNYEIDLIITDVMMSEMDGIELCKRIKSSPDWSHIKVLLLTACANESVKSQGEEAGADLYIEKPFAMTVLKKQVQNLLENQSKLRQSLIDYPWFPYNALVTNNTDNEFLIKINDLVEENLTNQEFDVDKLTEAMNMSRSSLHRKIKGITNLTPNDYIRLYRLKKSAMLLGTGQYKVTEVCYMVGFNTPSYFSKCFQTQFGIMPKEFLAKVIQESNGN